MNFLTKSYLAYSHGESWFSPWQILRPLGWIGSVIVKTRCALYDHGLYASEEPSLPVISVGNLTTGGTNKTPFVEYVVRGMQRCGVKAGVVSRGYGGKTSEPIVILNCNAQRSSVGDEPLLLSSRLPEVPIAVSCDRFADVAALARCGVDVAVADDAFQHRKLARDVDIVLVDASCPFGNGTPLPNGILREAPSSLGRAHIVVITKADQVSARNLEKLKNKVLRWVPENRLFYSRLGAPVWQRWNGEGFEAPCVSPRGMHMIVFSAIGNPKSFHNTVTQSGAVIAREFEFKDHHRYSVGDLRRIADIAAQSGADALCCTEKDTFNLPPGWKPEFPLLIPRIHAGIDDPERFWRIMTETLRPKFIVASNGLGEDAIGSKLAEKMKKSFPLAEVSAFPLVGRGEHYSEKGVELVGPLSNSPTGGIIKYHFKDLCSELRSGLLKHIAKQFNTWKQLRHKCRSVICVGDAYLLCHTLWGQGKKPLLLATAKTQLISGHWKLENSIYRKACKRVWTRDEATAAELRRADVNAVFEGNPIMDLLGDNNKKESIWGPGRRILLLPGSRPRAYRDLSLLLSTLKKMSESCALSALMVIAPSLSVGQIAESARGWVYNGSELRCGELSIKVYSDDLAAVAPGAELLIGLAGTANQVCAGMGIPVLSIKEKGKYVQKKLLGESELLVEADAVSLAAAALLLLKDPERLRFMGEQGKARLGRSGALDAVIDYAAVHMGWKKRCSLYEKMSRADGLMTDQ